LNKINAITIARTKDNIFSKDPVSPLLYPKNRHNAIIATITISIIIAILNFSFLIN
jgi:hypothetical protein